MFRLILTPLDRSAFAEHALPLAVFPGASNRPRLCGWSTSYLPSPTYFCGHRSRATQPKSSSKRGTGAKRWPIWKGFGGVWGTRTRPE